ncbi:cerebellin-2-like [Carassius gibelio]|uniref:cerebellin-2-like n=1 Tax=Carassius gibelio TaxID=101364 RepID=UPI0022777AE6|nr:cerebellin-2-like [Carassius gibelio]
MSNEEQLTCPFKKLCTDLLKELGTSDNNLQATETRLKALENSVQDLMSRLAKSEAEIEKIQMENSDRTKVAFSASIGPVRFLGPCNTDVTLVYKNVIMNVGNAYNNATGIFTAPVRGIYYFSFFYHCMADQPTLLALYRNGNQVAMTKHHKSSCNTENGGNGVTLLLEKGEQVYIVLRKDTRVWDEANAITVFSGFLINVM